MSAFDYEKQVWVDGAEAVTLRRQQLTEELDLLRGPKAQEYARFIGCDVKAAIVAKEAELREVEVLA